MDEHINLWMIQDEEKYLEEIMKCRTFKFLHRHVIAYSNILIRYNLLEPFPSKAFTLEKSHRGTTERFGQGGFRRIRRVQVKNLYGWLFGRSKRDDKARLEDPRFGQPMLSLFVALTTRKTSHIHHLG